MHLPDVRFELIFVLCRPFILHLPDVRVEQLKRQLPHLPPLLVHRLRLQHPLGGGGRGGGRVQEPFVVEYFIWSWLMRTKYIMAFLQVEYKDLCKELLLFAPPDSRIAGILSEISSIKLTFAWSKIHHQGQTWRRCCKCTSPRALSSLRSGRLSRKTLSRSRQRDHGRQTLKSLEETSWSRQDISKKHKLEPCQSL